METVIRIRPEDNVAIARRSLSPGEIALGVEVREPVESLHKVALVRIPAGGPVIRYGQVIGTARQTIEPGCHVHTQNLGFDYRSGDHQYRYAVSAPQLPVAPEGFTTFNGFRRANGTFGTRNYLAVVSSVNCSGHVPRLVAEKLHGIRDQFPNIDGVIPLSHQTGCGITMGNEAHEALRRTFAGTMNHPNIAGLVFVGLGCEQLDPSSIVSDGLVQLGDLTRQGASGTPVPGQNEGSLLVSVQSHGGTAAVVDEVTKYLLRLAPQANGIRREPISVAELILAMNCGGSDALSGITANPALGLATDYLVALGGTSVLAETPETVGAEHLLAERARTPEVGMQLVELIRWWERYMAQFTFLHPTPTLDNNPSKGNKAGGLTTIVEKSLGAVAKAGSTALNHVLPYAGRIPSRAGLCFMNTPGKDSFSMTGLVAGGANVAVFTTGRGNVAGWAPTPTIKLCTNTPTFDRLAGDMDLNAGAIMEGSATMQDVALAILAKIVSVANGERTASETLRADRDCFDPWYCGPAV